MGETTEVKRHPGGRPRAAVRRDRRVTVHFSVLEMEHLDDEARVTGTTVAAVIRAHVLRSLNRMERDNPTP